MSNSVLTWWSLLSAAACVNVILWLVSAQRLERRRLPALAPDAYATRRLLLWLGLVYVLGCAFRSVLPMVDVPRMCLHDTPLSRIFVGRSVATVAEVCFALQFAVLLREAGRSTGSRAGAFLALAIPLLIIVAEVFSWSAVLSTNYLLHAIENSLWTLAAVLGVLGFAGLRSQLDTAGKRLVTTVIVCGLAYVSFMVIVDVPMYLGRWQADIAAGSPTLPVVVGLQETLARCTVVREWSAWREDVPWLTLYFTTAVWISVALPHAPALARTSCSQRTHLAELKCDR